MSRSARKKETRAPGRKRDDAAPPRKKAAPRKVAKKKAKKLTRMEKERIRKAQYAAKRRAAKADITIPKVKNLARRKRALADAVVFLQTYFPDRIGTPLTEVHMEMIETIKHHATHGGDQSIAAPRGEGKTTLLKLVLLWCILKGLLNFLVFVGATQRDSERLLLNDIKWILETNELLAEDFPEVCVPIRALEGAPARANKQTYKGERTRLVWQSDYIILPTIKGSKIGDVIIVATGLEGSIRGLTMRGRRPQLVAIDDPDTRESARSEPQTKAREQIIEQDLAGLGSAGQKFGRLMTTTIMTDTSISASYTDPRIKPSWHGKRYKLLVTKPTREDLWLEYIQLRQKGQQSGSDPDGREAHRFYRDHQAEMDEGAVLINVHRFNSVLHEDGEPMEISALQRCYNLIADRGWKFFATEYQNDPPEEEKPQDNGITAELVRSRINGRKRGFVPDDAIAFTAFIDLGKYALHYAAIAWFLGFKGQVVDYGVVDVHNAREVGEEPAILHALRTWRDTNLDTPYVTDAGEIKPLEVVLVDSGAWQETAFTFVRESGSPFRASKGYGQARGMKPYPSHTPGSKQKYVGENWFASLKGDIYQIGLDTDHWKRFVHHRFLCPVEAPGSLSLWGDETKEHTAFSHHIVAEIEKEEFVPGKGVRRYWHEVSRSNHYLDCVYGAAAAAGMLGVRLFPRYEPQVIPEPAADDGLTTPDGRPYLITER